MRTLSLLCFFLAMGALGLFTTPVATVLPEFWLRSSAYGMHCFLYPSWWKLTTLLLIFGLPSFFCLKIANRCADALLDRFGLR